MKTKIAIAVLALSVLVLHAQQSPSTAGKAGAAVQKQAQTAAKPAEKPKAEAAKDEPATPENGKVRTVGKRDPFESPIVKQREVAAQMVACGSGKKCLIIDQINLQGVVKSASGNIAVVTNSAKRAYFLRENDGVYRGRVHRITPDSVVFLEEVVDRMGRASTREVVKRVNPGPA